MKNLILIRHAKSDWSKVTTDIERPLSDKGIRDAFKVSEFIDNILPKKFIVWSSIAKRAKDTAIIYAENLSIPLETIIFKKELYTFDVNVLEKCVKKCDNKYSNLVLFGHNNAIIDFVNKFSKTQLQSIPTSSYISIQFEENDWNLISKGILDTAIFPKQIDNERIKIK